MDQTINLTPSAINKFIKSLLEKNKYLTNIKIVGEVSNFKTSSGHFYFSIKDDEAQVNCVCFKNNTLKFNFLPQDGMQVIITGSIYHNIKNGYYSINVTNMEEDGIGRLEQEFIKLKQKLEQQGLFDQIHKQQLQPFYQRIALVTAPTSAAIKDMLTTIKRRNPLADVVIVPTIVQGQNAAPSIVKSINYVNDHNLADVMIVGRGGGSIEDLWAFNEEVVAMATYNSKIPIVSSVGHETDFTIIDFVSDMRAATPTAAAEYVTPDINNMQQVINNNVKQLAHSLKQHIQTMKTKLVAISENQYMQNPLIDFSLNYDNTCQQFKNVAKLFLNNITNQQQHLMLVNNNFQDVITANLKKKQQAIVKNHQRLDALNPLSILSRGYSVASCNDHVIKSIKDVNKGDKVTITTVDGIIDTKVENSRGES